MILSQEYHSIVADQTIFYTIPNQALFWAAKNRRDRRQMGAFLSSSSSPGPGPVTGDLFFNSFAFGVQGMWSVPTVLQPIASIISTTKAELYVDLDGTGSNMTLVCAIYSASEGTEIILNPNNTYTITEGVSRIAVKWTFFDLLGDRDSFVRWEGGIL